MKKNLLLGSLLLATAWGCNPGAVPAQEPLTTNAEPWTFTIMGGIDPPICNLQVQGYTKDGMPGPLLVLQWKDGVATIIVTYDNIDQDLMTIYNAAGSAYARMVVARFDQTNFDQASFVPDFPIVETLDAARQISFASESDPLNPYGFIDLSDNPFNALVDWGRCAKFL